LPSYKVYEDDKAFAFLDIMPRSPGHTLVLPKARARNILDVSPRKARQPTRQIRPEQPRLRVWLDGQGDLSVSRPTSATCRKPAVRNSFISAINSP
jgi:HIT domain